MTGDLVILDELAGIPDEVLLAAVRGRLWYEPTPAHPDELVIVVRDTPAPQGSKNGFSKEGSTRVHMVESSKRVKPWRNTVVDAALKVLAGNDTWAPGDGPVYARLTFTTKKPMRPKSPVPDRGPDLDKLVRAVNDALTTAGAWADDARLVEFHAARRYPLEGDDALNVPGVVIRLRLTPWGTG